MWYHFCDLRETDKKVPFKCFFLSRVLQFDGKKAMILENLRNVCGHRFWIWWAGIYTLLPSSPLVVRVVALLIVTVLYVGDNPGTYRTTWTDDNTTSLRGKEEHRQYNNNITYNKLPAGRPTWVNSLNQTYARKLSPLIIISHRWTKVHQYPMRSNLKCIKHLSMINFLLTARGTKNVHSLEQASNLQLGNGSNWQFFFMIISAVCPFGCRGRLFPLDRLQIGTRHHQWKMLGLERGPCVVRMRFDFMRLVNRSKMWNLVRLGLVHGNECPPLRSSIIRSILWIVMVLCMGRRWFVRQGKCLCILCVFFALICKHNELTTIPLSFSHSCTQTQFWLWHEKK